MNELIAGHWLTALECAGALLGITGAVLNARRDRRGFIAWIGANLAFIICDLHAGLYWQSALLCCYIGICIYGLWHWNRPEAATMPETAA